MDDLRLVGLRPVGNEWELIDTVPVYHKRVFLSIFANANKM